MLQESFARYAYKYSYFHYHRFIDELYIKLKMFIALQKIRKAERKILQ